MTPRIVESDGSIFDSDCAALVNPVDAVTGAQGKGLALEFKRRWPERCEAYRKLARGGGMSAGGVRADMSAEPAILFTATKLHWSGVSTIKIVRWCLWGIGDAVSEFGIASVAIPALGCGLGSLRWDEVRPLILDATARMQCERVVIYGPK